eukprot:CAMPEP_0172061596 /NCGR_PEP_ID=MMETSP1043-20130122/8576_1 /TAXON_ID=464988 /ORGANISM="Hemiselmis andersenii, Strain CCMP441" /LENGTH=51 /DNA_ID=CAMNT_0012721427 /DNA_START=428 /DNA_END=583 /DNA_ORIENTATION=-
MAFAPRAATLRPRPDSPPLHSITNRACARLAAALRAGTSCSLAHPLKKVHG